MQRAGTYSVIPRVPGMFKLNCLLLILFNIICLFKSGGELLPEQLVELGLVAKKYNLYSKITGAQRVGLFGASKGMLFSNKFTFTKIDFLIFAFTQRSIT